MVLEIAEIRVYREALLLFCVSTSPPIDIHPSVSVYERVRVGGSVMNPLGVHRLSRAEGWGMDGMRLRKLTSGRFDYLQADRKSVV